MKNKIEEIEPANRIGKHDEPSHSGMIIITTCLPQGRDSTPINRGNETAEKENCILMKSSLPTGQAGMTQATHGGMIIIARFHPDLRYGTSYDL